MINFGIPNYSKVSLKVFNVKGQLVKTLVSEIKQAGLHSAKWDGTDSNGNLVSSGIYFYKLEANNFSKTMKMTFLK